MTADQAARTNSESQARRIAGSGATHLDLGGLARVSVRQCHFRSFSSGRVLKYQPRPPANGPVSTPHMAAQLCWKMESAAMAVDWLQKVLAQHDPLGTWPPTA